ALSVTLAAVGAVALTTREPAPARARPHDPPHPPGRQAALLPGDLIWQEGFTLKVDDRAGGVWSLAFAPAGNTLAPAPPPRPRPGRRVPAGGGPRPRATRKPPSATRRAGGCPRPSPPTVSRGPPSGTTRPSNCGAGPAARCGSL